MDACRWFFNAKPETQMEFDPVSYTHLDVYKRQGISSDWQTDSIHLLPLRPTEMMHLRPVNTPLSCLLYTSRCV